MSLPPEEPFGEPPEEREPRGEPIGFWGGVLLIVLVQILANVIGGFVIFGYLVAAQVPVSAWGERMPGFASIGIIANTLGFLPVVYFAWRRSRLPASGVFPLRLPPPAYWLPILLTLAGGIILAEEVANILYRVLPPPDFFKDLFAQIVGKGTGILSFIFLVIVAPVTEESLFRGVILSGFLRRYSVGWAIVWSAFLFGVIHLDPWQLVPAFMLGILFALWRVQTGSLWPPLLAHAATNGMSFVEGLHQNPEEIFKPQSTPLWVTALGVALLLAGLQWGFGVQRSRQAESGLLNRGI